MKFIYLLIVLAPLFGAAFAGLGCRLVSRTAAHSATILGVALSCLLSIYVLYVHGTAQVPIFNESIYTWMAVEGLHIPVGFLVDNLTAMMMVVVTFVSLMVHIYTVGYMAEDPGYNRFFSYISLFTFSMLMLVMSNNFMQLFFGWEAVGLMSYLLIGFWFKKPTATYANMKAFLVNRVGDFGFILGIACVLLIFGSLDYQTVFAAAQAHPELATQQTMTFLGSQWTLITFACIFLFIGAMGKSAQVPLHVWLPDSMEGPTPISALIHAATMVTAGIFMVARMSPLFELSTTALSFILVIGAITALFMGFLGIIQNDIKRVVAYSTLSQLGYMTVALGASAYSVAVFHLMTHAFFKALLFLGAGSVIMAMHHEQDIRFMGGLKKYMPITWITSLIGSLALIGTPFFSGFYSKESIILAVENSGIAGSGFATFALLAGVFITAFYSFRMYFLVFHGPSRFTVVPHQHGDHDHHHLPQGQLAHTPHESPWVVTLPLVLLAIPSLGVAWFVADAFLKGTGFEGVIVVDLQAHPAMQHLANEFHGVFAMGMHGFITLPCFLALAGVVSAWYLYMKRPDQVAHIKTKMQQLGILKVLENKYYFDQFNQRFFAEGSVHLGNQLWKWVDAGFIDGFFVNGSAQLASWSGGLLRKIQTGYLYHAAFAMVIGLVTLMTWVIWCYL